MRLTSSLCVITLVGLLCAAGCARQNGGNDLAENTPPKDVERPRVEPQVPKAEKKPEVKQPEEKKPEPEPVDDGKPWPKVSDEPPTEPKAIDPKILEAWKAAGARTGWATQYQFFDDKPDFRRYPELLPYVAFAKFEPNVIAKLPVPDQPFLLYLFNSGIPDSGLAELAHLKTLRKLDLTANYHFTGAGFEALADLPDLRILSVYQTQVNDAASKQICQITSLRELNLGATRVTDAGLVALANLKKLQILRIWGISISDTGLKHVGRCKNLRTLSLCRLNVKGPGLKVLANLEHLETLSMAGVYRHDHKDSDVEGLGELRTLRSLNLNNNPELTDSTLAEIGKLKELRSLHLDHANVTAEGVKHLSGLPHLEALDLNVTRVGDEALAHLAKLENLTSLALRGTKVTAEGVEQIVAFESKKLRTVNLPTAIPKETLDEARKKRPNTSFSN